MISQWSLEAGICADRRMEPEITVSGARMPHQVFQFCGNVSWLMINEIQSNLQINLLHNKISNLSHCLTRPVINHGLILGMFVSGSDQILSAFQVKIPPVTSGLQKIQEDQQEDASHSTILIRKFLVAQRMRQCFHSLMLEEKRIAIRIDQVGRRGIIELVKRLAGVGMVASCRRQKSFHQHGILHAQWDKAPERIFVTIIYDEELANAFVVCRDPSVKRIDWDRDRKE